MALRAEPGDILFIDGAGMSGLPRTGTIIAVAGRDGTPPYLVRWTAGDYESRISPGPGARIENSANSSHVVGELVQHVVPADFSVQQQSNGADPLPARAAAVTGGPSLPASGRPAACT